MRALRARLARRPDVTVCVPAYEAESFVEDTLASVQHQSHRRLRVLISVDASTDDTEAVCRRFEPDPRFSVQAQTERLGWVGNINFLLDRVETDLFMILPHDDLLDRDYVTALRAEALAHPEVPVVYCDIAQVHRGATRYCPLPCSKARSPRGSRRSSARRGARACRSGD